jgi:hypothetical protein
MKVVAYTALHYGRTYLKEAIRSIIDLVDEYYVFYSKVGSHGSQTKEPCPDTRESLFSSAYLAARNKMKWYDGVWARESDQRAEIHERCPGADVVVVLDADEIWSSAARDALINYIARYKDGEITSRRITFAMIHFWRSFYQGITDDLSAPPRVIFPKLKEDTSVIKEPNARLLHFGYAQDIRTVYYKQLVHGHRPEWRNDINWFQDRFLVNAQTDCHPVVKDLWNIRPIDARRLLPPMMMRHPNAQHTIIGEVISK